MSRRKSKKNTRQKKSPSRRGGEWIGGRLLTPFYITEGPEPYRPELVLWMEMPEGLIVGQDLLPPGDEPGALGRALENALRRPLIGPPRRPSAIRVAEPGLAAEVRAVVGDGIPVTVAATPELDDLLELMSESMASEGEFDRDSAGRRGGGRDSADHWEEASYLEAGRVSPAVVAELFSAAELLHLAAPWKAANDNQVLRLDIPELGVDGACVSIIGALGESVGLLIFPSLTCFDAFARAASNPPDETRRIDVGTSWLSFTFERGADLPASMRREVAAHGWPVADALSYPRVEHRDPDGMARPLTERDVRIASACATSLTAFFVKHGDVFEAEDFEPICESYSDDRGLTVRFTLPYQASALFDVSTDPPLASNLPNAAASEPKVGRNDPCPCGSGKKYKKCHLRADQAQQQLESKKAAIHQLDQQLVHEMSLFAMRRFEDEWLRYAKDFVDAIDAIALSAHWSVYHYGIQGRTIREWFCEEHARDLSVAERAWLSAQEDTWLSVWEVTEVQPGESLMLEDLLTREVRHVREAQGSETLAKRDALLGRIVEHEGLAVLCGVHPHPLPPTAAAEVVRRARGRLRRKRAVPVERLQDEAMGRYLIRRWEEAVEELDRCYASPPQLHNTDGDPLLLTTDHFELDPANRCEVESRLAVLEGVEVPDPDDERSAYTFIRPGNLRPQNAAVPLLENTVIGRAWLSGAELHVETNSTVRADALLERIEAACGDLIRHRVRDHSDPLSSAQPPTELVSGGSAPPPEAQQLVLDFKAQHYADWLDQPLPALAGRTPREAAQTPSGRSEVEVLLKEMENLEQRMPVGARFDFSQLRTELALD
jgi:hypothetical protein